MIKLKDLINEINSELPENERLPIIKRKLTYDEPTIFQEETKETEDKLFDSERVTKKLLKDTIKLLFNPVDLEKVKDIDPEQLSKGIKVEKEHTSYEPLAELIATHHLLEDPKYYEKLETLGLEEGYGAGNPSEDRLIKKGDRWTSQSYKNKKGTPDK